MISPLLDKQIPVLPRATILAVQLFVGRDGQIVPDAEGYIGRIIQGSANVVSQGSVWAMTTHPHSFQVFQTFLRYEGTEIFGDPSRIRNPNGVDLEDVDRVVTGFAAGILGAARAGDHAQQRVMTEIEMWQRIGMKSNATLTFALETNLEHDINVAKHEIHCNEMITFSKSNHPLAGEIRKLLRKMRNPKDIRNRQNVYRMVLMVRAIQRRALELAQGKQDSLAALLFRKRDVEEWVNIVVQRASTIASELNDNQPWWMGVETTLPKGVAKQRVTNFVKRLRSYIEELKRAYVEPFRYWAAMAAHAMQEMVEGFEQRRYESISHNAQKAVAALEAIVLREEISLTVQIIRRGNDPDVAQRLARAMCTWIANTSAPIPEHVRHKVAVVWHTLHSINATTSPSVDQVRGIEAEFDAIAEN